MNTHCGWRGYDETRQLVSQSVICIQTDKSNNAYEYQIGNNEKGSKTRIGGEGEEGRINNPTIFSSRDQRCPVLLFKLFRDHIHLMRRWSEDFL